MTSLRWKLISILAVALFLLSGCGGGGAGTGSGGRATLTITWPKSTTRLVPVDSQSIVVSFLNGSTVVASQTVAKPTSGSTSTVSFTDLPIGAITLQAEAFPQADGTGIAQASASESVTIERGSTAALSITMASTIASLSISPNLPVLSVGGSETMTATALDATGAIVLTSASTVTFTSSNTAVATISTGGLLTAETAGTSTITATESESGKSVSTLLTVNASSASPVLAAANVFLAQLTTAHQAAIQTTYSAAAAKNWVTSAVATRNGLQLATLSKPEASAAQTFLGVLLSSAGATTVDQIRMADQYAKQNGQASATQNMGYGLYNIAFIGTPSATSVWSVQVTGDHVAYNFTFNGNVTPSATPVFLGTEPTNWTDTTSHAPLETQRLAVSGLAAALQADTANSSAANLGSSYTDLLFGATSGGDTTYPPAYPTGTTGRGVQYTSLNPTEQAGVRAVIEAYVNTVRSDIAGQLLSFYENSTDLNQTYVAYQVGSGGTADFSANPSGIGSQGSYLRIDGPRIWIEFISVAGVAFPTSIAYHSVWRDKSADYGGEF